MQKIKKMLQCPAHQPTWDLCLQPAPPTRPPRRSHRRRPMRWPRALRHSRPQCPSASTPATLATNAPAWTRTWPKSCAASSHSLWWLTQRRNWCAPTRRGCALTRLTSTPSSFGPLASKWSLSTTKPRTLPSTLTRPCLSRTDDADMSRSRRSCGTSEFKTIDFYILVKISTGKYKWKIYMPFVSHSSNWKLCKIEICWCKNSSPFSKRHFAYLKKNLSAAKKKQLPS